MGVKPVCTDRNSYCYVLSIVTCININVVAMCGFCVVRCGFSVGRWGVCPPLEGGDEEPEEVVEARGAADTAQEPVQSLWIKCSKDCLEVAEISSY